MKKIILASGSPRRKELLELIGIIFEIKVSNKEEVTQASEPQIVVQELAKMKAYDIAEQVNISNIIIGADTIVVNNNQILGKPKDEIDAFQMLKKLQGNHHKVYTGVTILEKKEDGTINEICFVEETKVSVTAMSEYEIESYIKTGEPMDKAGGYGIQGNFAKYISAIEGDYYNVMGLPVCRLYHALKQNRML